MADCPKSLWRPLSELTENERRDRDAADAELPESVYDDLGWRLWADSYRHCRRYGISPAEVDRMELWQLAAIMNLDLVSPRDVILERMEVEKDTLAERAAKMREGRSQRTTSPPPAPDDPDGPVDVTAEVMRQMGIRTA